MAAEIIKDEWDRVIPTFSILAATILLCAIEDYHDRTSPHEEEYTKQEIDDIMDSITGLDLMENLKDYGTEVNFRGLINGLVEIHEEFKDVNKDDVISFDWEKILGLK